MPFPQQAVEALTRKTRQSPGWFSELFLFSTAVLAVSVMVYGGVRFGYQPYVEREVAMLKAKIEDFGRQVPAADQERIVAFYSQLSNLRVILDHHTRASSLFSWLEANTLPRIYFSKLNKLNVDKRELQLSGFSKSLQDIPSQVKLFESQPDVMRVDFGNIAVTQTNLWQFDLTITFRESMFGAKSNR